MHLEGRVVRAELEEAREQLAGLLVVRPRQVIFTSGATESINAAVWGAVRGGDGGPVLCAGVEHSAVRDASARLAEVEELAVDGRGRLELDALDELLGRGPRPALVHCQWANHEVGTLQPVFEAVRRCREAGVPVHVDAAAALGHVPLPLGELEADLVSVSGHKIGAPPGIGALVVRRGARFEPLLVGGAQERARRGGMENVPGALALGAVAARLDEDGGSMLAKEAAAAGHLVGLLERAALAVAGVSVVGDPSPEGRLPHILCLGVEGVEAEPVLLGLDRAGVGAHSGSACSSETLEPSPVLAAMGADPSHSLRLSVGWSSSEADAAAFAASFPAVVGELRVLRGDG